MVRTRLLRGTFLICSLLALFAVLVPAAPQARQSTPPPPASKAAASEDVQKQAGEPVDPKTYVIGVEDILKITVWQEPDLSGPVVVRPDDLIALPLLGEVKAGGLTPEKLKQEITRAYAEIITKPDVMVSVVTVNSKKYFILGEVNRPGQYQLVVPTTVMEALAIAGGLKEFANTKNIVIIRDRGAKRYKLNYKNVIRGNNLIQNIYLQSGDMISVP